MQRITLYRYTREDGGTTVDLRIPEREYTVLFRLIAEDGMMLVHPEYGSTPSVDTAAPESWSETAYPPQQCILDHMVADGMVRLVRMPSDKLGFDWVCYYVNGVLVRREYEVQQDAPGTLGNPIAWEPGLMLIRNAYYTHSGECKVWMGASGATADWGDPDFVIWREA